MSQAAVLFELVDDVAVVTLNEGDRMNPLSEAVRAGLLDALRRVHEDKAIRALLLTGRGRGFCVGADLDDFGRRAAEAPKTGETLGHYVGHVMASSGNPIVTALRSLPVPVICAVNGVVAGGGVGLALAADMVVAARSAYFYLPFVPALGIVPDMGSTWTLPRAIGSARAVGLALTGEKLSAHKAAEWGLIWACIEDEQLQVEAMKLARQLAALPAHAIGEARALFAAAETNNLEQQLELERERQQVLIDGESFNEGLKAFAEKRKPGFRGR
jgi:2-(1,2-epoxy-1,2-dihydrophenyl)acetyl-CoA isomerase